MNTILNTDTETGQNQYGVNRITMTLLCGIYLYSSFVWVERKAESTGPLDQDSSFFEDIIPYKSIFYLYSLLLGG